jgi:hypothetical protein
VAEFHEWQRGRCNNADQRGLWHRSALTCSR